MAQFEIFISSLREQPLYGEKFEHFTKWFLENDPEWAALAEKVWLWNDWPDRWGPDCGIDLVFRHKNGEIWAVQAKCYDSKYSVTKKDIDSFLSESNRKEIDHRLLVATTDRLAPNAARASKHQEKPVTFFKLQDFQASPVDYPDRFEDLQKAKVKPRPSPRPHQKEAIEAVVSGLAENDRGQLIMACGTGKTFTTLWIKEALKPKLTLVLLPSLSLLSQTMREWAWGGSTRFSILNVCSDLSVGRKSEDMSLDEAPYPVTSNIDEIRNFLRSPEDRIVFCTYHSSPLIAEAQAASDTPDFDLVVADEAHRCAGKADSAFTTVLNGDLVRAKKRLFTTATPRMYGPSVKAAAADRGTEMYGMDDEAAFGPELHRLTFGEAINRDLLTDYQVVVIGVTEPMVKEWIDEEALMKSHGDEVIDARSLAAKIGILKAIRDYKLERIISFHSRVKSAQQFSEEINELLQFIPEAERLEGTIWSDYVSGGMSAGDRKAKIDRLKALEDHDVGVLTNARCLSEGVDVPSLDGIAFIDPRGSQVDIIQAVGRAIRRSDNKEKGTIVIPVFIEAGDDFEESMEGSSFKPIWDVIKALRSHDDVLAEILDSYRQQLGRTGEKIADAVTDKIIIDLPISVPQGFISSLQTMLVENTTANWEQGFGSLLSYFEANNDTLVATYYRDENNYPLGKWVSFQRTSKDHLATSRLDRLESIGFVWNKYDHQWEMAIKELQKFHHQYGHTLVPQKYKTESGFKLGLWASNNRARKDQLSEQQILDLERLGFVWDQLSAAWTQGIEALKKYVQEFGDAAVSKTFVDNAGFNLGKWVATTRSRKLQLTPKKISQLDELGFVWNKYEFQRTRGLEQFKKHLASDGSVNVAKWVFRRA